MKFEILLEILFDLLNKKVVNATDLAFEYGVSKRTIYRYINCLENAGVPIYTNRGKGGGICIIDTYRFSSTFMTVKEFEQTISALSAMAENVPNKTLTSAIKKLKSAVKNEYTGFDVKSGNLIIDAGPWGDSVGYKSKLVIIQNAIEERKILSIIYHDRNGTVTTRNIEPHVIVFKQGLWYVYAFCQLRNEFRFFKLGRIEGASLMGEIFNRREIVEDELPLNFWHNNVKAELIELEIDKSIVSDIEEWLGIENVHYTNGKHVARAYLPYDNGLLSKIMSYGNGIKIIAPEDLRDKVKNVANDLLKLYN